MAHRRSPPARLLPGLAFAGAALAAAAAPYELHRARLAAGGDSASGGSYHLVGTVGQAEAADRASGGSYTLSAGFRRRAGVTAPDDRLFTNGFELAPRTLP